jgi:hypothetical protein
MTEAGLGAVSLQGTEAPAQGCMLTNGNTRRTCSLHFFIEDVHSTERECLGR